MFWSVLGKIHPTVFLREAQASAATVSEHEQRLAELCRVSPEEALRQLGVGDAGLTEEQVEERRGEFGANELAGKRQAGVLRELWTRCKNPLVIQLAVICVISLWQAAAPADYAAAALVGAMIFFSVVLAYLQEHRSSRAVEKLQAMVHTNCEVWRDGRESEVPMAEIVPGDVVVLHAGAIIPADLRLLSAKDFFVSQSSLTGESMPVEKTAADSDVTGRGLIELPNACFQGSNVLSGTARGVVVNTGVRTHFGAISAKLSGQRVRTSFDRGIAGFTWLMIRFMVVMALAVFLVLGLRNGNWTQALLCALAIAVGLTPEMLPMIVTVNLAKGALAMSRKKVIIKRLNSIQNFGAIDTLCTDKTGTLTQDRVILEKHVDVTNRDSDDVLRYAYMNSYYQTGLRNLLDRSILSHTDLDVERNCRKVDEIPFDFQRKRMSVVVDYEGDHVLICKGAVEDIYKTCTHYQIDDEIHLMIDMIKNDLLEEYEELSKDGYRVLAIAYREFSRERQTFTVSDEAEMTLLGYIAFLDPPKDSSARAIASLKKAGVVTKILTGDNALVTRKICKDVGLAVNEVITGDQLLGLDEEQLGELAERQNIFARLSPSQKESIIVALQKRGHVVGYLGDGINDAPSMRVADVGISVDTAVDVAKESADVVLLEKSLLVLEDGIIEGRRVFGNIIKYIRMSASSNFGNMFSMLGASLWLPFLPMLPVQILLNNLLYDFSQIGIPSDKVDDDYLLTPRKWNIASIRRFMVWVGPASSIFDYATFFLMLYFFNCALFKTLSAGDGAYYEKLFHTGWFVESIITQTLIVHVIRTRKIPFLQSLASPTLIFTTLAAIAAGCAAPYLPSVANFLGLVPLPGTYWIWIAGFVLAYVILTHLVKTWFFKKYGVD
ncbi:MAG: magnesium-translocating P-type ATPase [Verrucomicrobiales bacterium]|jgi:Mg2+-importing ATPase|nr:magnesium-translocating P-type ATPase [Verrucomicrobiales bacterium]